MSKFFGEKFPDTTCTLLLDLARFIFLILDNRDLLSQVLVRFIATFVRNKILAIIIKVVSVECTQLFV